MTDTGFYLLLVETSGNQRHIFETNRLRENVGASQQIWQLGQFVLRAVHEAGGPDLRESTDDDSEPYAAILDDTRNLPIESESATVEVWSIASGKALVLTKDRDMARAILRSVTTAVLRECPGVNVQGAIVPGAEEPGFSLTVDELETAVRAVHEKLAQKRSKLPPVEARFPRLPVVAECHSSGLPASTFVRDRTDGPERPASVVVAQKRRLRDSAIRRMEGLMNGLQITRNMDDLETWLGENRFAAVIHADGTGVGRIFQSFQQFAGCENARSLINRLREFSQGIDRCTRHAFAAAVRRLAEERREFVDHDESSGELKWRVPLLPLIVGGDDVTVLCSGAIAVPLVTTFFREFERKVSEEPAVAAIAERAFGVARLGMCAGVAMIKPHYPFHAACSMAEDLQDAAKRAVKDRLRIAGKGESAEAAVLPVTAFDFHVHHSASGDDVSVIRESIEHPGVRLWGGPFLVTDQLKDESRLSEEQRAWIMPRTSDRLQERVDALNARDPQEDRTVLPSSQLQLLRNALPRGPEATRAQLALVRHRYRRSDGSDPFGPLLDDNRGPFWTETSGSASSEVGTTEQQTVDLHVTALLDAMALARMVSPSHSPSETASGETVA